MRKLIILRGAMGSGKSTFIEEHHLEEYTLSADKIRLMFNSPEMNIEYREVIPQFNNQKAWDLLYSILESRMRVGELTIIDAVHSRSDESFPIYKKLAEKYRYRLYILDFTDVPKEEVYKRNLSREDYKVVPEYAIDKAYKLFIKEKISSSFKVIKREDFDEIINTKPKNMDKYERIHIFGDIHGCCTVLKEYFKENLFNEQDAYIFLGDYFDRGLENFEVFKYLSDLSKNENVTLLTGNHEDKLYKYACGDEYKSEYALNKTIEEFEQNGLEKSEIRGFIKKLAQISYITFGKNTYLLNHGGIPYIPAHPLDFYSTNSFIYGIGEYICNIDEIYDNFMKNREDKIIQIHGHRNYHKIKFDKYMYSLNLDGNIENGNYLRVLTLDKDGKYKYTEIKNDVYDPDLKEKISVYGLIQSFRTNKYIFEKDLGNSISSFNFSKDAFYNKVWNTLTTTSRGLFIDTKENKIIARSYNKFFNINERKETSTTELENSLNFPVNFYLKYNGFLGILSVKNDELFFASKSTNEGHAVETFKKIFYNQYDKKQIEALKNKLSQNNLTALFEVIDPIEDPHIIEYTEPKIILLDMVYNRVEYEKIPYEELKTFSKDTTIEIKELIYSINNTQEFKDKYNLITKEDYKLNGNFVEGFVIEDSSGFMVKIKTDYYNKWKHMRALLENVLTTKDYTTKCKNELEKSFIEYLKERYENKDYDLKNINIIEERRKFYKEL